jgi:hypothetical protein
MERKLNKKVEAYITSFKENIKEKSVELGINKNENVNQLIQYIYDYDRLNFGKEDFMKRKRVKNVVPFFDRCCAKRANDEQCTRRKKEGSEYCGTHVKGSPHGIISLETDNKSNVQKIEVWAQDIQGIIYYIDKTGNVYQAEDIVLNIMNPKIIAKYVKNGENYTIPEFNLV